MPTKICEHYANILHEQTLSQWADVIVIRYVVKGASDALCLISEPLYARRRARAKSPCAVAPTINSAAAASIMAP